MHKMKPTITATLIAAVAAVFVTGLAAVGAAAEKPGAETPAPALAPPKTIKAIREAMDKLVPTVAPPEAIKATREDKWGLSVFMGPYTLAAVPPWSRKMGKPLPAEAYDNLYKKWKPDRFDARHLVDMVKRSGARQLVFQVTLRDGFSLYDTKFSDYKITGPGSPWKRDLFKEVADECHAQGLKLWILYATELPASGQVGSPSEYHANQLRELLTNYGRIDGIILPKGERLPAGKRPSDEGWFTMCQTLQPHLLFSGGLYPYGDLDFPEHLCNRSGNRRMQSSTPAPPYWDPRGNTYISVPPSAIIREVARTVVADGMWHPCLGLMPDGRIEPETVEMLLKVGEWMGNYGESIYETRGGPYETTVWGGTCYRGKFIYMHVLKWPGDTIHLLPMERKIVSATVLTGGTATVKQTDKVIEVQMPLAKQDRTDTIIKLELDGPVDDMKPIPLSLTYDSINDEYANANYKKLWVMQSMEREVYWVGMYFHKMARSSDRPEWPVDAYVELGKSNPRIVSDWDPNDYYAAQTRVPGRAPSGPPGFAVDDQPGSRWTCAKGVKSAWLEVDLRKKETFSNTLINERGDRVRRFELQVRDQDREDEPWRTVHTGTTIGEDFHATFPATTARYVRLNLIETTDGPEIIEFQLY